MVGNIKIRFSALALAVIMLLSLLCGCKPSFSLDDIPEYSGAAYVEINDGEPFFKDSEITDVPFESYSELDALGRCGVAFACIGIEIMPTEDREDLTVTPSGWERNGISNNNSYDFIQNNYVYNRCHLIGFQLAGENDNEKNLITGTRYLNMDGMLPFENLVDDYVEDTGNHVMYRVTPIFEGLNLVASGVLMEGYSVEDNGLGICFCIYAYNVQPGVTIDYFTGVNVPSGTSLPSVDDSNDEDNKEENNTPGDNVTVTFILNINSKKFHLPGKSCADSISEKNRENSSLSREELIEQGYSPCGICKP